MKITQQYNPGNTPLFGSVTYRDVAVYALSAGVGALLFFTPLFKFNWVAIIGYVALVSVLLGKTPTGRSMATNIYGIVFRSPTRMVVTSLATINTLGHGIRNIDIEPDMDTVGIRMTSGNYALVYVVTSGITNWSTVVKHDSDTGMMALKKNLDAIEDFEGDDLLRMSERRKGLLIAAGTSDIGRSVQQYLVLQVKPKNVNRCVKAMRDTARLIRPADYPIDILLAAMGFEQAPKEGVDVNG